VTVTFLYTSHISCIFSKVTVTLRLSAWCLTPLLHRTGETQCEKNATFPGAFYHVTSRTNDKIRVFDNNLGRKIMLIILQDAKDRFKFCLTNFCVMPTHIHLLIKPNPATNLSDVMKWIKSVSAKRWNFIHGSTDHLWRNRFLCLFPKTARQGRRLRRATTTQTFI